MDTNVLLDRTFEAIIEGLKEPTRIILVLTTLEELDTFKKGFEPKNEYARAANRFLDSLRQLGKLHEGVPYGEHIIQAEINLTELDLNKPDYRIIKAAKEANAVLVTQDIHMRVIADAVDVPSTHYASNDVDVNQLYTGVTEVEVTDEEVQEFACCDYLAQEGIDAGERKLVNNQFIVMKDQQGNQVDGIYKEDDHIILPLKPEYQAWGIKPKKDKYGDVVTEQEYLMHLLLDPEIEFITALGPSGTGKTLLTLAAALEQTLKGSTYRKITVMRPLVAIGNDIGYLPGDKLEKLEPWMASTFDALELLLEDYQEKDGDDYSDDWVNGARGKIYGLIQSGRLELEAMAHIRGRSLPNQFIIIDDAQNLTQHEAASIITRAGDGTKVVFLGDLSEKQIDNHRLTPSSNGLAYVIDRFKGEDIVGHITLNKVVRSRLAQLGVEKL